MSSSLIRGKYIIGRVIDNNRAVVNKDGARLGIPMHMYLVETAYQKEYARRHAGSTASRY